MASGCEYRAAPHPERPFSIIKGLAHQPFSVSPRARPHSSRCIFAAVLHVSHNSGRVPIPTNTPQYPPIPYQYPLKSKTNTLPIPSQKQDQYPTNTLLPSSFRLPFLPSVFRPCCTPSFLPSSAFFPPPCPPHFAVPLLFTVEAQPVLANARHLRPTRQSWLLT